jgi:hypothetical protein
MVRSNNGAFLVVHLYTDYLHNAFGYLLAWELLIDHLCAQNPQVCCVVLYYYNCICSYTTGTQFNIVKCVTTRGACISLLEHYIKLYILAHTATT